MDSVIQGAFHSTKLSGNFGSESGNSFRKFRSTSRGCPFFRKFGNSGNFLFHLAFLPWILPRPKLQDGGESTLHWMQNDLSQFEPACSWLPILHKNVTRIWFSGQLWTGRSEFRPVCKISREKSSQVSLIRRIWCLSRSCKYQGRVCFK